MKNLKQFVRDNKPCRLVGGCFDGKEMFIPSGHQGDLRLPVPTPPPITPNSDLVTSFTYTVAIYVETWDSYRWEFSGYS